MTGGGASNNGPPGIAQAALGGLCPRCGAPELFSRFIRFAPACGACGLDYDRFNVGDGPAAIITLVFGTVVTIAALIVELRFEPPWWVHVLLWLPITLVGVIALLRVTKAALIAIEYRKAAGEHRGGEPRA